MPRKSEPIQWTEDDLILAARGQRQAIFDRVLALTEDGNPHVRIAAAKLVLELAGQKTQAEADPLAGFNLLKFR